MHPKERSPALADLTHDALVEAALCFGWVDGVPRAARIAETVRLAERGERANHYARKRGG